MKALADPDSPLTPRQAAAFCNLGLTSFRRYVAPHVPAIVLGSLRRYLRRDLLAWLEQQKAGVCYLQEGSAPSTAFASAMLVSDTSVALEPETLSKLRAKLHASIRKRFPGAA